MAQEQLLLEKMTFRQLRRAASKYNIPRYGRMRKAQLLSALKQQLQEQTVQQPKIKKNNNKSNTCSGETKNGSI